MNKVKIGFLWKRTNILQEQSSLDTLKVEAELQGIDLYKLRSVFERVMKRKKKVKEIKKLGRPNKKSNQSKLNF